MDKSAKKKTSAEWAAEQVGILILDPDGWCREHYEYSWYKELITFDEFSNRLLKSTVIQIISEEV